MRQGTRRMTAAVLGWLVLGAGAGAAFSPWAALTADGWVNPNVMTMHTVNGGDYTVGFDVAQSNHAARGMNALKFSYGGASTGHLTTSSPAGSFTVLTTGSQSFADLVVLVAIDSDSLPVDFSMSLGRAGQTAYPFNPTTDFGFYDPAGQATGRPSGYYSNTSPTGEGVSYSFSRGMVTAWAVAGANLAQTTPIAIDYAFNDLPGPAVFSVYGYLAGSGGGRIQHTNRAVADVNNSGGVISTFEVVPEPSGVIIILAGAAGIGRARWRLA